MYQDWSGEAVSAIHREYLPAVRRGDIRVLHATVKEFSKSSVVFELILEGGPGARRAHACMATLSSRSGRGSASKSVVEVEVAADTVVSATGFEIGLQPLDEDLVKVWCHSLAYRELDLMYCCFLSRCLWHAVQLGCSAYRVIFFFPSPL